MHVIYANLCQFKSLGGSRGVLGGLGVSLGGLGPPGGAFAELLGRGLGCLLGAFWMPFGCFFGGGLNECCRRKARRDPPWGVRKAKLKSLYENPLGEPS